MSMRISVVIPAYNAGRYIGRAIDSVLAQTRPAEEIIVVDDGSTDHTAEIAGAYGDRIRFIRQENAGASVARNTGIAAATGNWIAFLDADDEWLPEKLRLQTEHLERNPDLTWTTANYVRCYCDSNRREDDLAGERLNNAEAVLNGREYFQSYFQAYQAFAKGHTITMLVSRELIIKAGLFARGQARINDYDMWLRIAYVRPRLGFLCQPLATPHRDVPNSLVKTYRQPEIIFEFLNRHLQLAAEHGLLEDFRPCASRMLGGWIHTLLAQRNGRGVRMLLRRFADLHSRYCYATTYIKSYFPRAALWYELLKGKLRGT